MFFLTTLYVDVKEPGHGVAGRLDGRSLGDPRLVFPAGAAGKIGFRTWKIGFWNVFASGLSPLVSVGVTGFEPVTLRLSSACSNQLSYTPVCAESSWFFVPGSSLGAPRLEWRQGDSNP